MANDTIASDNCECGVDLSASILLLPVFAFPSDDALDTHHHDKWKITTRPAIAIDFEPAQLCSCCCTSPRLVPTLFWWESEPSWPSINMILMHTSGRVAPRSHDGVVKCCDSDSSRI